MILKKPYALIIKNFRLIHFFMLIISSYILYRTDVAYRFFDDYAKTRQFIESNTIMNDTLPLKLIILALILLLISFVIFILFRKKDKPTMVYISSIIFYSAFMVALLVSRGILSNIIVEGIDPRIARIVRDIWLIIIILEVILVGFYLIRALGFDVKKFNFGEDVNELKIEEEDSEEFELNSGIDKDKLKVKLAMQKEEYKSFYYENKSIIISLLIILTLIIPSVFVIRSVIANKRYAEKDIIDLKNFNFSVEQSYITKKDSNGETIFKSNNSILIVKFKINNLSETKRGVNLDNMRIEANDKIYSPNITYYEQFKDIGNGYTDQTISKEEKEYIVLYVVDDNDLNDEIIFRYADHITVKKQEASALYYRIILNPEKKDALNTSVTLEQGQTLIMPKDNIKFNVTHYNIKDKFTYEVSGKTKYIVNNIGLVLSLNYEYSSENNKTLSEFLTEYCKIKYVVNNKEYTQDISDITPKNYDSNIVYLAVKEEISEASNIELIFNARSTEYVYKIK